LLPLKRLCQIFFLFLLSIRSLFAYGYADFNSYQHHFTKDYIEKKIHLFLKVHSEVENYYQISDNHFSVYASLNDKQSNKAEFTLKLKTPDSPKVTPNNSVKKRPIKIAIDPGHFGGMLARLEERYIPVSETNKKVLFDEGTLTLLTALYLKDLLCEKGYEVMLTRDEIAKGVYEKDFHSWLDEHKEEAFENLALSQIFRRYYNRLDLLARAEKINQFNPDLTLIIHYNAHDEKNSNSFYTSKNFNLVFIPGAFSRLELKTKRDRYEFVRLLLTDHIEKSLSLSQHIVKELTDHTQLPLQDYDSAFGYITNCSIRIDKGIFCRNLGLTRLIHSPLCYGETLIQNNKEEIERLKNKDTTIHGIGCSSRIKQIATAYYKGINRYLTTMQVMSEKNQ